MGKKITYKENEPVNEEGNLVYIGEAESHISSSGARQRRILVKDLDAPDGQNIFSTSVGSVRAGTVKHAPSVRRKLSYQNRRQYNFNVGDFVNPSQTLIYISEGIPKETASGEKRRTLRVKDIYSNEVFDCLLNSAVHDRITMGPEHRKQKHAEIIKKVGKENRKYQEGEWITNNILFVEELSPLFDNNNIPVRYGKFYNSELDIYFTSRLRSVLYNEVNGSGQLRLYSNGERKIKGILDANNIFYLIEYSFKDCSNPKTGKRLRFDFYLPNNNILIEFDGEQHYKATGGWNNKDAFKERVLRDSIKDLYVNEHYIKLIRIPYWDLDKLNYQYLVEKGCVE